MDEMKQLHLLGAAKRLVELRHTWNVLDIPELAVQDSRNGGTPYHHVTEALSAILRDLGVGGWVMEFHAMVLSGMTPVEALAELKEQEAEARTVFDAAMPAD